MACVSRGVREAATLETERALETKCILAGFGRFSPEKGKIGVAAVGQFYGPQRCELPLGHGRRLKRAHLPHYFQGSNKACATDMSGPLVLNETAVGPRVSIFLGQSPISSIPLVQHYRWLQLLPKGDVPSNGDLCRRDENRSDRQVCWRSATLPGSSAR
jgi:hypothetical protein